MTEPPPQLDDLLEQRDAHVGKGALAHVTKQIAEAAESGKTGVSGGRSEI